MSLDEGGLVPHSTALCVGEDTFGFTDHESSRQWTSGESFALFGCAKSDGEDAKLIGGERSDVERRFGQREMVVVTNVMRDVTVPATEAVERSEKVSR